ncbi:MAG: MarR family winged helix-turn-helix transcriptional regulator, partial [Alphaproteobacteria bacterium]
MTNRRQPGETSGLLLWRTANAWQRRLREALADHGLTQAQFTLLDALANESKDGTNQRQLATRSGMDVTVVSAVIRQLQRDGLVARRTGTDARSRQVTLTAPGRARVGAAAPMARAVDAEFFAPLRQDQSAFAGALRLLLGLR